MFKIWTETDKTQCHETRHAFRRVLLQSLGFCFPRFKMWTVFTVHREHPGLTAAQSRAFRATSFVQVFNQQFNSATCGL